MKKLHFFTVVASSLVVGHSLQATDVISSREDAGRCPPSHYSLSSYSSSSNDFSDPHPGQERIVYPAQSSHEEYILDNEAMKRLWEGMPRNPITQEEKEQLFSNLEHQQAFQVHLLSDPDIEAYNTKLIQVLNFRTNNSDLIRRAVNEISVDNLRKKTKNLKPQGLHIPTLKKALFEQISTCTELMKTEYGKKSLLIQSNLTDALITFYKFEKDRSKRQGLRAQIDKHLDILKKMEIDQGNPKCLYATYEELAENFGALKLNKKTT